MRRKIQSIGLSKIFKNKLEIGTYFKLVYGLFKNPKKKQKMFFWESRGYEIK